eukprot:CAMPEP_0115439580 /NCGR_PEP_ID=MMETSP0271-20121206/35850_1 /TAXON_ID=71861 /ORGANISM="Scrippsiella trochoidea, Strain CCMP3099" /LENGTH=62 /DNA_ID=CAMNT_0002865277 /DNA_START=451 /DNA_END=636 /DNA_ORIENTATION=-
MKCADVQMRHGGDKCDELGSSKQEKCKTKGDSSSHAAAPPPPPLPPHSVVPSSSAVTAAAAA